MPPPKPPTSTSTENLVLKCQKETHKKCLPPEWSIYPPNQPSHPPHDTLALAIQIDASSPTSVTFYESSSDRLVGSIGSEYRGSIVVVPWRTGLKFICQSTCRRRTGCRIGVVREAKTKGVSKLKSVSIGNVTVVKSRVVPLEKGNTTVENKKSQAGTGNVLPAAATTTKVASPMSKGRSGDYISRIPRRVSIDKTNSSTKHVSFDDKSIGGKTSIDRCTSRLPRLKTRVNVQPRLRC